VPLIVWVSLLHIFCCDVLLRTCIGLIEYIMECMMVIHGDARSLISTPIESKACTQLSISDQ